VILEYQPAFLGPSSLQGFVPWYSTKHIPEEAKVCSPEIQGSELALRPRCPKDPELHHFMVTAAKAALELHIPHQPLLVGENKVQHSPSTTWRRKLSSTQSRNLLDCLCPTVLSHQQVSGWLKFRMKTRACVCEACVPHEIFRLLKCEALKILP